MLHAQFNGTFMAIDGILMSMNDGVFVALLKIIQWNETFIFVEHSVHISVFFFFSILEFKSGFVCILPFWFDEFSKRKRFANKANRIFVWIFKCKFCLTRHFQQHVMAFQKHTRITHIHTFTLDVCAKEQNRIEKGLLLNDVRKTMNNKITK